MAALTRQERKNIASPWVRKVYQEAQKAADLTFSDLEPAIQATEDWIQANQGNFLAVLPQQFKSKTNGVEKTLLFVYVVMKRAGLI